MLEDCKALLLLLLLPSYHRHIVVFAKYLNKFTLAYVPQQQIALWWAFIFVSVLMNMHPDTHISTYYFYNKKKPYFIFHNSNAFLQ